jgi:SAM-dependent methyltransferase
MPNTEEIRRYYDGILPFYDESLADRGDLPFWEAMATRWGARRILELGCGTGRVTEVLTRHAPVTAADLLLEMLLRAARRAPKAHLVAADLRQFALAATFDLIVLADDPMAHLISTGDRARVQRLIADHLAPGGRVVLEGLYRQAGKQDTRRGEVEESWSSTDVPSVWRATYRHKTVEVSSLMRSWSREEVAHLEDAGLHVESVWGDFDESPFRDDSERIIVVGRSF